MSEVEFRNQKCKDRVKTHYKSRMNDVKTLWYAEDNETEELGSLFDYGLSIDYVTKGTFKDLRKGYFRYQLSWGGPSEEFRLFLKNGKVHKVEFWLLDWFDGAKVTITNKENIDILTQIVEMKFENLAETASEQEQEALEEE